ncbi:MAG: hypothetical protein GC161_15190 [Planctomycetaceae bacterium]|nr:hypothetical protein [Planctomycetaceae bacterium]
MSLAPTLLAIALSVPQTNGGFTDGQLVLLDRALNGASSTSGGIAIIDPLSGAITKPYSFFGTSGNFDSICYDPYRGRILFNANPTSADPLLLLSGDAQGNYEVIGFPNKACSALAPVGDGRVYFRLNEAPFDTIRILDANNQVSLVTDGNGQPYIPPFGGAWSHLEYHVASNSLVHVNAVPNGSCGGPQDVTVRRIDLSPDGTQAVGDACVSFVVEPLSGKSTIGLTPLDPQSMLLTVNVPQPSPQPRFLRIQVEPLAISVYATPGFPFAATTRAGAHSRLRNQAVLYDTAGNALRAFSPGQSGEGYLVTPIDSLGTTGAFGQLADLIEVNTQATAVGVLTAEPQAIGVVTGGTVTLQVDAGPTAVGQLHIVVGSLSGVSPGISVGSTTVPLVPDTYFFLTLSAGSPLTNPIGFLDAQGKASSSLSVGPLSANFVGLVAQHAAVLLDPVTFAITGVTSPVAVPLIP